MPVIDASSIVHAWDNYPIDNFPKLWNWMDEEFSSRKILIPSVALEEVEHVSPECFSWLKTQNVEKVEVSTSIVHHAQKIKAILGIANDEYSSGVDENDVIIIATAKALSTSLVSNEEKQPTLPKNLKKYKIPAVCRITSVAVDCDNIAAYIKQSKKVF